MSLFDKPETKSVPRQKMTSREYADYMKILACQMFAGDANTEFFATEGINNSDVIGVSKAGYLTEIEIKVSMSDFRSERDSLRVGKESVSLLTYVDLGKKYPKAKASKIHKHREYLNGGKYKTIPKFFYIMVTPEMLKKNREEILEAVEGTPYGIMTYAQREFFYIGDDHKTEVDIVVHKSPAEQIKGHSKLDDKLLVKMMRRICYDALGVRKRNHINKGRVPKW